MEPKHGLFKFVLFNWFFEKMKISIWSLRWPKLDWVIEWTKSCPYFEQDNVEFIPQKVESWVSDMPLSLDETMLGAKNRVQNMLNLWNNSDFYVWLEWWTTIIEWRYFLFWVVYIENNQKEWHYGISSMIELPKLIWDKLYKTKKELHLIMDEISGNIDTKSKNWTFWELTDDMILRNDQFKNAFLLAIAPFFNKFYK